MKIAKGRNQEYALNSLLEGHAIYKFDHGLKGNAKNYYYSYRRSWENFVNRLNQAGYELEEVEKTFTLKKPFSQMTPDDILSGKKEIKKLSIYIRRNIKHKNHKNRSLVMEKYRELYLKSKAMLVDIEDISKEVEKYLVSTI